MHRISFSRLGYHVKSCLAFSYLQKGVDFGRQSAGSALVRRCLGWGGELRLLFRPFRGGQVWEQNQRNRLPGLVRFGPKFRPRLLSRPPLPFRVPLVRRGRGKMHCIKDEFVDLCCHGAFKTSEDDLQTVLIKYSLATRARFNSTSQACLYMFIFFHWP